MTREEMVAVMRAEPYWMASDFANHLADALTAPQISAGDCGVFSCTDLICAHPKPGEFEEPVDAPAPLDAAVDGDPHADLRQGVRDAAVQGAGVSTVREGPEASGPVAGDRWRRCAMRADIEGHSGDLDRCQLVWGHQGPHYHEGAMWATRGWSPW
jgi:hypothetical protein